MSRLGVEEIAGRIKTEILASGYKAGDRLPSSAQVMEMFGGSPVTCMKAYKTLERDGLVDCVQGKGVFLKDESFKSGIKRVGLLTMDYGGIGMESEAAFGSFMKSAGDELRRNSCSVARIEKEDIYSADAKAILEGLDAIISSVGCIDARTIPLLESWGRPVVVLQHEDPLPYRMHQVIPDLRSGYRKAIELFVKSGAKRLTIASNGIETHNFRIGKFLKSLQENPQGSQMELFKLEVERIPADMGRLTGREIGERLLRENFPLEAIFAPSDFVSFGILDSFLAKGLRPGVDFRLIGYDNLEGNGMLPYGEPLLASVDFPRDRIARQAVRILAGLDRLGAELTHIVRVPCDIFIRASLNGTTQKENGQ